MALPFVMTPFAQLVNAIFKEVKDSTRKLRIKDKLKFSVDLALVASSIRTAYLVDSFAPPDHVLFWRALLQNLRANALTSFAFASVVHVFEPASEQSFIVNISMIPKLAPLKSNFESERYEYPVFVQISQHQTFQLLDALPQPVFQLLDSLNQTFSPCRANPEVLHPVTYILPDLSPSLSVPLAAILLDYGVAYVPESESSQGSANSFSGVPIYFFEAILTFCDHEASGHPDVKSCTIMKFSCPATEHTTLNANKIISHLDDLFTKRLRSIGDSTLHKIEIRQTTHSLDRLAF